MRLGVGVVRPRCGIRDQGRRVTGWACDSRCDCTHMCGCVLNMDSEPCLLAFCPAPGA